MSNYLEGVFHPAYSFDSISGFQTILNTSLEGNVTIGNLNTSFGLLLNGLPINGGGSTYEWSQHPAVQYVMIDGYDISGISTFNGMDVTFDNYSAVVGIGSNNLSGNTGSNVNALGRGSAQSNTGSDVNAFGIVSAFLNTGSDVNAMGYQAASSNAGNNVNAIGVNAAYNNSGSNVNGFGSLAAVNNTGNNVNAIGVNAAYSNAGSNVNAIGYQAAYSNTGNNCTFIGSNNTTGTRNTLNNKFIVYGLSPTSPFIYGDTQTLGMGIGTSNLSANLNVSGSFFATGSIYDSTYSSGISGQILSSTGSGTQWITGGSGLTNPLTTTLDAGNQQIINLASPTTVSGACTIGDCQTLRCRRTPSSAYVLFPNGQPLSLKTGMSSEVVGNDINTAFVYPEWAYGTSWVDNQIMPPVSMQFNIKFYSSNIPTVPLVCSATFVNYDNGSVVINKIFDTTEFVFIAKDDDSGERYFGGSGVLTSTESQTFQVYGNGIHPTITFQFGGYTSDVSFNINALNPKGFVEMIFTPLTNSGNGY